MNLQQNNFGLRGQSTFQNHDDGYDHLFKKFREKLAEKKEAREEKKADRKQRKEEKRSERQEKRELNTEKKKLKNELKQTQIEEKKAQLSMLNQAGAPPSATPTPEENDNTAIIVAAIVGLIVIANVGYFMIKKQTPAKLPGLTKAA